VKKIICVCILAMALVKTGFGQIVTTDPAFPSADKPLTITVDVTGTSLDKFPWDNATNPVWIWTWIPKAGNSIDAPTNVNPATAAQDAAKCTRISTNPDRYQITFTPTVFFNKSVAELTSIGLKLKTRNWNDNKQTDVDKFITLSSNFSAKFTSPTSNSFFVNSGEQIPITISASAPAELSISVGGMQKASQLQATTLSYTHTVTETQGSIIVTGNAKTATDNQSFAFTYTVRNPVTNASRPGGIIDGINYSSDATKVTLSLWAPKKSSVYVLGDFNDWQIKSAFQMKKDGERFWLEITGLTPGQEYGFQYLVDEKIKIADPYADKILDPDDQFIPAATFPSLKSFPTKALNTEWYFNRVSTFQTAQTPYVWKATNYTKPAAKNLVIYELHIRDFFESTGRNYQNLIDTVNYFKRLGVNAIELMPITEFNGNDSWGYNPTFMFAVDKYYGTKNKLKEFIDKCHQNGIAVILDIVMNHQDIPNPYALMYFDFGVFKPATDNPWFNRDATHPFNVFNDMNHESSYTKKYLDTVNHYWINQFKFDGLRFDLSKGFTQTNNPNNVGAWGNYDASRIAILKRMNDKIKSYSPDAYVILEHFAANSEENELASYGMMSWGNANNAFAQASMGFSSSSDISGLSYKSRGSASPSLVGYMESHDEERIMYKNIQFGNASGSYSVKNIPTGLNRLKAANTILFSIPGPKMIWQFGELGYDQSINTCTNGTVNNDCRVSAKPVKWNYLNDGNRASLRNHIAGLLKLRSQYPIFESSDFTVTAGEALVKQVGLKNSPFKTSPSSAAEMNVHAIANFGVSAQSESITFSHTGTWYDYFAGGASINVATVPFTLELQPGDYRLYTDFQIATPATVTGLEDNDNGLVSFYPNPTSGLIQINSQHDDVEVNGFTLLGQRVSLGKVDNKTWDISLLPSGLYILRVKDGESTYTEKIIKN
jgi:1,4-alpha-glucan branching enzyme